MSRILFWMRKVRNQGKLACKNISGHSDLVFHNEIGVLLLWKRKGRFWTGSMCHCMRHPYVTYFIYLAWEIFIIIGCGNHGNVVFLILLIGYYLYALRHRIPDFNTSGEEWSLGREMSVLCRAFKAGLNFGYYRDALGPWTHSPHIPHNTVQIPECANAKDSIFVSWVKV